MEKHDVLVQIYDKLMDLGESIASIKANQETMLKSCDSRHCLIDKTLKEHDDRLQSTEEDIGDVKKGARVIKWIGGVIVSAIGLLYTITQIIPFFRGQQ
jgi:hypothetical protein